MLQDEAAPRHTCTPAVLGHKTMCGLCTAGGRPPRTRKVLYYQAQQWRNQISTFRLFLILFASSTENAKQTIERLTRLPIQWEALGGYFCRRFSFQVMLHHFQLEHDRHVAVQVAQQVERQERQEKIDLEEKDKLLALVLQENEERRCKRYEVRLLLLCIYIGRRQFSCCLKHSPSQGEAVVSVRWTRFAAFVWPLHCWFDPARASVACQWSPNSDPKDRVIRYACK